MTRPAIRAAALQFNVTMDPARNAAVIERLLDGVPADTFAVAPEGALSGYLNEAGFVSRIDEAATAAAIERIAAFCVEKRVHLVTGACLNENGAWRNASLYFGPNGERHRYDKVNLAQNERGAFEAGDALPVFDIDIAGQVVRVGIQMCREIRYPEQWRVLAVQGAQIIATEPSDPQPLTLHPALNAPMSQAACMTIRHRPSHPLTSGQSRMRAQ